MKEILKITTKFTKIEDINPLVSRFGCNVVTHELLGNGYRFPRSVLEKMIPTLKASPVVTRYYDEDDKFGGHQGDSVRLPKQGIVQTDKVFPCGFVDYQSEPVFKNVDNVEWLCCETILWTVRYPYLENIGERDDVFQSMEVAINFHEENNEKVVDEAWVVGLCLIGISPAFKNSGFYNMSLLDFSDNNLNLEVEELKKEYQSFKDKYNEIDFSIPKKVKENAQKGLDLRKEYNRGGTSVGLAMARYIIKNEKATPEKIKKISQYFPRHSNDNLDEINPPSNGYIAWLLWGGSDGWKWSDNIVEKMKEIDENYSKTFMSMENLEKEDKVKVEDNNINNFQEEGDKMEKEILENTTEDIEIENQFTKDEVIPVEEKVEVEEEKSEGEQEEFSVDKEKFSIVLSSITYAKEDKELSKYTYLSNDKEYCFAIDKEDKKIKAIPYSLIKTECVKKDEEGNETEEKFAECNVEFKLEEVKCGKLMCSFSDVEDDEVYMSLKSVFGEFTSDENTEALAIAERNKKEAEDDKALIEEEMTKIKEELSKVKEDMSKRLENDKTMQVEAVLSEVIEDFTNNQIDDFREQSKEFTLENIDIWKNKVRAEAFSLVKSKINSNTGAIGLPFVDNKKDEVKKSLWS